MKIAEDDDFERRRAAWIAETQRQLRLLEARHVVTDQPSPPAEPPCLGLDPDTYECPFCGATLDDECGTPGGAWRVGPGDPTEVQKWTGSAWATDCYLADAAGARKWVLDNIREGRACGR